MNEALRARITRQMFDSMKNFAAIQDEEDVLFKRKNDSLGTLLSAGVIDLETARDSLVDALSRMSE